MPRQNVCDVPRTKFGSLILSTSKKEGGDYANIVIILLLRFVSKKEQKALKKKGLEGERYMLFTHTTTELLLKMEEFSKHDFFTKKELEEYTFQRP